MKNFTKTILTLVLALFAMVANADVQEISFNKMSSDPYNSDIDYMYENLDWVARFDVITGITVKADQKVEVGKTYTVTDLDPDYSYLVPTASRSDKAARYVFTEVNLVFSDQQHMEATVKAQKGTEVITAHLTYADIKELTLSLTGTCEYFADMKIFDFVGKTTTEEYKVEVAIAAESLENGKTYTELNLNKVASYVTTPMGTEKISKANLTLAEGNDSYTLAGDVVSENDVTYHITMTTNIPSTEAKKETVDFGAILQVSEDEGDIKLVAENEDAKFVGYIKVSPVTTDVPSGEYTLLSYSKYGKNSDFGYMLDAVEDGKVTVTNNEGEISIVATFKQNNVEYTVTAKSAAPGPEMATVTITEGEGAYTVTSTSADALLYICKPLSWLDEGQTPESALNEQLAEMASMIDSKETWELYDHMGMLPAPKTFALSDYQAMYAGQDMFLVAANVGWDGKKLGLLSNVALQYFTVPTPTGITSVAVAPAAKAVVKFVENGKLVIVKGDKTFNAAGQRM